MISNDFSRQATPGGDGGGGCDSNINMPGYVCPEFENGPILNDTFWCKTYYNAIDYPIPFIDLIYLHTDCSSLLVGLH